MRILAVALLVASSMAASALAQRAWKEGAWAAPPTQTLLAIETEQDIVSAQPPDDSDSSNWAGKAGEPVRYAIDGSTMYVLDRENREHALRVVNSEPKYSTEYGALGGGHYIKSVTPGGLSLTLEDATRWDIDPRQHFAVAGWTPDDLVTVRRSTDDPAFAFEIDNTSRDDGTLANRRVR
jgi:hypothetical protein